MPHIVIPTSATEQGHAFEDLILSYYQKSGRYTVREWSSYLHGTSGKWWQCDGIVEDNQGRYLVEDKFFSDRPATARDVNPTRRQSAARDLECTGILYISLNGFSSDLRAWSRNTALDVQFLTWTDLRDDLLSTLTDCATVLLDTFELTTVRATNTQNDAALHFDTIIATPLSAQFPEFVTVPDGLERWLRRMPRFPLQLTQISSGHFWYNATTEQVALVPNCTSDLSLQQAWAIQDTISGYASRAYNAVRATAQALGTTDAGMIEDVQGELHKMGWKTGRSGIRSSLDVLILLGLVHTWIDHRRAHYVLSPLGKAYVVGGPDDDLFAEILKDWLPYRAVCDAIVQHHIPVTADDVMAYFKAQYAPYEPYARSLFNPNKADGLVRLYKQFGG